MQICDPIEFKVFYVFIEDNSYVDRLVNLSV